MHGLLQFRATEAFGLEDQSNLFFPKDFRANYTYSSPA